jgi:ribonucleoside-diphosphate reductase alpha chain
MQVETQDRIGSASSARTAGTTASTVIGGTPLAHTAPGQMRVIKRNGTVVPYEPSKIAVAITKAFLAVEGGTAAASSRIRDLVNRLEGQISETFRRRLPSGGTLHIEDVQDQVELSLMRSGEHKVARAYVLYREERSRIRAEKSGPRESATALPQLNVTLDDGSLVPLDLERVRRSVAEACAGLDGVDGERILAEALRNMYDGISLNDVGTSLLITARTLVEEEPNYTFATARLLMDDLRREALTFLGVAVPGRTEGDFRASQADMQTLYPAAFAAYLKRGIELELISPTLRRYDLARIGAAIRPERDLQFTYLGLQTLYDRYFLHCNDVRFELPQAFFMRVAMGLALEEDDREARAIEFYDLLSSFDYMASTPTLFNAGTLRAQLSSCFLTTVSDDLDGIYNAIHDNAMLSKWAGGLGNDWTPVRALGSYIKGTNGKSQGVVPFLKVVNDTAVAVNQGGKRKGAVCAYLETWHLDIEEFLELRKNTGDDRRRTHDMNTANWIPDLFMKRVIEGGHWTLFSPSTCPDLHDKFGAEFEAAYTAYEDKVDRGEIKLFKRTQAKDLWRKMLSMLFETGHPWITFKDACNVRSPQQHVGVVHSSNLCTEITLNTSDTEIAVCNLGSVNLAQHLKDGAIDQAKLKKTVATAMRMLDNVIDINYYAVKKARDSNLRHRPVGLGIMGFQDCLYQLRVPYASAEAVAFADRSMEAVCYYAYWASTELAAERGRYSSYRGSLWDRGILPQDSLALLAQARGGDEWVQVDRNETLDWSQLRQRIATHGMRNSNCVAIAPTATISNIIGVDASIEPSFGNLSVKSNLSGEFTVVNEYLVRDLKKLGLWDDVMVVDLKHFDGSLRPIDRVPEELKRLYATAFEVDPSWLIEAGARRQKWIDQAQSLNIYMAGASGRRLDETYKLAWLRGLKTTYYLRTTSATYSEKSTVAPGALNAVSMATGATAAAAPAAAAAASEPATDIKFCSIDDPDCEACQ